LNEALGCSARLKVDDEDRRSAAGVGSLYGFEVTQRSAFESRNLGRLAFNVTARRGPFSVEAGVNGLVGGDDSSGVGGRLLLGYSF
jgi:hypothetical protein